MSKQSLSPFEAALREATEIGLELRQLGRPRLSAEAFLREACQIADCDGNRLDEIEQHLTSPRVAADAIETFLRKVGKAFAETNWSGPCNNVGKLTRCYGSEQLRGQLTELRMTTAEAQALVVRRAIARWPNAFGNVEDLVAHEKHRAELQTKLAEVYDRMRETVSGTDLVIDVGFVTPSERARGLARVTLRRAPDVVFGCDDWPVKLVTREIDTRIALSQQSAAA